MTIAVVIPCYNGERYIAEALESVFAQTRQPQEIVVVNDGSKDDSLQILERYRERIVLVNQANQGLSSARNAGARASHCEWIAFLDCDDTYEPTFLESIVKCQRRFPQVNALFTDHVDFDDNHVDELSNFQRFARDLESLACKRDGELFLLGTKGFRLVIERNGAFAPSSLVIRRDMFEQSGGFLIGLRSAEDLEYYCRCLVDQEIGIVALPLLRKRHHADNMSWVFDKMKEGSGIALQRAEQLYLISHPNLVPIVRRKWSGLMRGWGDHYRKNGNHREALAQYLSALRKDPWCFANWQRAASVASSALTNQKARA